MITSTIQLKASIGPVAFRCSLDQDGRVTTVESLTAQLPAAALQLAYPNVLEEELTRRLADWARVLPLMIEAAVWLEAPPAYLEDLVGNFRSAHPDYAAAREQLFATDPTEAGGDKRAARISAWQRMGVLSIVANFPATRYSEKAAFSAAKLSLPYRQITADYLVSTFALVPSVRTDDWIAAIGKTRTYAGNDFLFRELERPGVLPYAGQVYTVLANSRLKLPADRILALYEDEDSVRNALQAYVHLLNRLPFPTAKDLLRSIVLDYPRVGTRNAVARLVRHDPEGTKEFLLNHFKNSPNYRTVINMLGHYIQYFRPDNELNLRTLNRRMADPQLHDEVQMNWPQRLQSDWQRLLLKTPADEFTAVIDAYLPPARGAVARNLLLQLKLYLEMHSKREVVWSERTEQKLLELLYVPYDKIYTVAIDVLRLNFGRLRDPARAVLELLRHMKTSRYRMMNTAALRVASRQPKLLRLQREWFREQFARAATEDERTELTRLLGYLSYLPGYDYFVSSETEEE